MKTAAKSRKALVLHGLALINDMAHLSLIIFLVFGHLFVATLWYATPLIVVILSQVVFMGCPLTMLSSWLRAQGNPRRDVLRQGLTWWVYQTIGRWAVIPLSIGWLIIIVLVRQVFAP